MLFLKTVFFLFIIVINNKYINIVKYGTGINRLKMFNQIEYALEPIVVINNHKTFHS